MTTLLSQRGRAMTQEERIGEDVCRQLQWQTDIQSKEIDVAVAGSEVTLSGRVETCLEKMEAENAAKAVHGVWSVVNNIDVKSRCARTDREIEDDINASLRQLSYVLEDLPRVSVVGGVVTLRGKVRWNFQRESASHAADAVAGVKQVRNMIEVDPLSREAACRKSGRRRLDTTPTEVDHGEAQSPINYRPMFFVPYPVGR
jgi:osmotically-inducible protein OsmY